METNFGFSERDAHALVLCEHLRDMGAAVAIIPIEWEGVQYEVSIVALETGAKTRQELERQYVDMTAQIAILELQAREPLEKAMKDNGAKSHELHVCGQCDGTGYV